MNQFQSNRFFVFLFAMTAGLCPGFGFASSIFPSFGDTDEAVEAKPKAITVKVAPVEYVEDARAQQSIPKDVVSKALGGISSLNHANKDICLGTSSLFNSASADSSRTWKSPEELERYVLCYLPNAAKYKDGFKNHAKEMAVAGEVFELPPNLIECSFLRESKYQPNSVSTAKCVGIAQIMSGTANDIGKIIRSYPKNSSKEAKLKAEMDDLLTQADGIEGQGKPLGRSLKRDLAYNRTWLWNYGAVDSWRKYYETMGAIDPKKFKDPKTYNSKMRRQAAPSIPAGALYFKYISLSVLEMLDGKSKEDPAVLVKDPRFAQCIAAIYNWGPGSFQRAARKYQEAGKSLDSIDEILEMLQAKAPRETRNYMYAIKTCSERNNFRSYESPEHRFDRTCEANQ